MRTAVGRSVARKLCSDARTHGKWNERASPVTQTPTRATDASAISVTQRRLFWRPRRAGTRRRLAEDVYNEVWVVRQKGSADRETHGAVTNT